MRSGSARAAKPRPLPYLAVLGLAAFCHGALLIWLLHAYGSEKLDLPFRATAGVTATYLLAVFGLRLPAARLVDRVGIRSVTIYALAGCALSFAGIANATSGWLLLVAVAIHGACGAVIWPAVLMGLTRVGAPKAKASPLGRILETQIAAIALGAVAVNLLACGGVNLASAGLMVVWIGTVFASLTGLPEDEALPPVGHGLMLADDLHAGRRPPMPLPWPSLSALAGTTALGMLLAQAPALAHAVMELPQWQVALAAACSGTIGIVTGIAIVRRAGRVELRVAIYAVSAAALIMGASAVVLVSRHAALPTWLAGLLAASLGAPGCVVAFAGSVVDGARQAGGASAGGAGLLLALPEAIGLTAGAVLAGLLWRTEQPAAAMNLTAAMFALAAIVYGLRACAVRRRAPTALGGS